MSQDNKKENRDLDIKYTLSRSSDCPCIFHFSYLDENKQRIQMDYSGRNLKQTEDYFKLRDMKIHMPKISEIGKSKPENENTIDLTKCNSKEELARAKGEFMEKYPAPTNFNESIKKYQEDREKEHNELNKAIAFQYVVHLPYKSNISKMKPDEKVEMHNYMKKVIKAALDGEDINKVKQPKIGMLQKLGIVSSDKMDAIERIKMNVLANSQDEEKKKALKEIYEEMPDKPYDDATVGLTESKKWIQYEDVQNKFLKGPVKELNDKLLAQVIHDMAETKINKAVRGREVQIESIKRREKIAKNKEAQKESRKNDIKLKARKELLSKRLIQGMNHQQKSGVVAADAVAVNKILESKSR